MSGILILAGVILATLAGIYFLAAWWSRNHPL